jgi:hypothetical protein
MNFMARPSRYYANENNSDLHRDQTGAILVASVSAETGQAGLDRLTGLLVGLRVALRPGYRLTRIARSRERLQPI